MNKKYKSYLYAKIEPTDELPPMVLWMMKHKLVRNPMQATFLLLITAGISVGISVNLFSSYFTKQMPNYGSVALRSMPPYPIAGESYTATSSVLGAPNVNITQ